MTPSSQLKAGAEPRKRRRDDAFTQAGAQPLWLFSPPGNWTTQLPGIRGTRDSLHQLGRAGVESSPF